MNLIEMVLNNQSLLQQVGAPAELDDILSLANKFIQ